MSQEEQPAGQIVPAHAISQRIAQRFNALLETRVSPRGKRYTLREISEGTGGVVTIPYLSLLRQGGLQSPAIVKIEALAKFFKVRPSYFTGSQEEEFGEAGPEIGDDVRQALTVPGARELLLRASEMGPEERAVMMALWERSREIAAGLRKAGGNPESSESGDAREED